MQQILTRRKQAWVDRRKPNIITGAPLNPNAGIEAHYYSDVAAMIRQMAEETETELRKLFKTPHGTAFFAEDASIASQARILMNALMTKFTQRFATEAPEVSKRMAKQSDKSSSAQLHTSIQKLSGGLSLPTTSLGGALGDIMTATIAESVGLIKTIPQKYLAGVQGAVMRSITSGNGLQDLVPYLSDSKGVTLRRARFIAKDQTKKAFENISTARMQLLGLDEFEWLHTGGSNHPREQHIKWSGRIFKLSDPPIDIDGKPTLPGQKPGCRCRKKPVISFAKD